MNKYIWLLLIIILPCLGYCEDVARPPVFERFYVAPNEILSTPYGTFYYSPDGEKIRVSCIGRDAEGTYVVLITRQCPCCGRYYYHASEKEEDFVCPIWEGENDPYAPPSWY